MTQQCKSPEYEGLKFFGKMSASISHEIRNALAVINENAGLVKDLILMSEKGHPVDMARIGGRVEKVIEQVKRTDGIVDNMNRFAHSVDNTSVKINACEYVEFVKRLSERFASMKGVTVRPEMIREPIEITTFPFLFENIVYLCLEKAMENSGKDRLITIEVHKREDRVQIRFRGVSTGIEKNFFLPESAEIFEKLRANIICEDSSGSFILDLPAEPESLQY